MTVTVKIHVDNGNTGSNHEVVVGETALNAMNFDFNPSAHLDVTAIKALCAALFEKMIPLIDGPEGPKAEAAETAARALQTAQMWAVKALFAK